MYIISLTGFANKISFRSRCHSSIDNIHMMNGFENINLLRLTHLNSLKSITTSFKSLHQDSFRSLSRIPENHNIFVLDTKSNISTDSTFNPQSNSRPSISTQIENLETQYKKDMSLLRNRLDAIERSIANIQVVKSKGAVGNFVESLAATTIEFNPRTVEILSSLSFFCIGAIIGASLLDRLWLFGGITAAWWASGRLDLR